MPRRPKESKVERRSAPRAPSGRTAAATTRRRGTSARRRTRGSWSGGRTAPPPPRVPRLPPQGKGCPHRVIPLYASATMFALGTCVTCPFFPQPPRASCSKLHLCSVSAAAHATNIESTQCCSQGARATGNDWSHGGSCIRVTDGDYKAMASGGRTRFDPCVAWQSCTASSM